MTDVVTGWLTELLTDRPSNWLINSDELNDVVTGWLTEWPADLRNDWLINRVTDWPT